MYCSGLSQKSNFENLLMFQNDYRALPSFFVHIYIYIHILICIHIYEHIYIYDMYDYKALSIFFVVGNVYLFEDIIACTACCSAWEVDLLK